MVAILPNGTSSVVASEGLAAAVPEMVRLSRSSLAAYKQQQRTHNTAADNFLNVEQRQVGWYWWGP